MKALSIVLTLFPIILNAVKAVEDAIPLPGAGKQKLDLVLNVVKQAYDASADLSHAFSWDKLVALVEFFLLAYSDASDVVFDPFMGSGTTMAAAALLNRTGYGCEISPAYCDVIVRRVMNLTGENPVLAATGETFAAVAESRGVPADQAMNPKQNDARRIQHHGPNPHYGPKRKAQA